ncbi:MAG: transcription termination factor NusA [Pirellulales bacterium]|nr:transcription termination factor NusA [Pirellulales bacterium]
MDPNELLRIVDAIHRDKGIDKEIVFEGIEAALVSAAKKHYGEEEEITFAIDRDSGAIQGSHDGVPMGTAEIAERIGAQTAKQVMIQKIREAERDALYCEYEELKGQLVTGVIQRYEGGAATVTLSNVEAILPKGEQIPGESHHPNERVRATVYEVKRAGSRVKIILSRTKPQLVQRLFEQEIPEIAEGVIEIRAISREPGYRTKVAVSSIDQRVDCVGACVGVRGNRIKNIVDELAGERIDIVRYSDDMQALIPNALQPAEVEEVILCQMLGRAIVLVQEDQLSLAIGRRGQNVRLASKLCIWDIEIMTREELDEQIEQAMLGFSSIDGVESELAERLVGEGFLSYDDLEVIEPDALMEMGGLTAEQVDHIVTQAGAKAAEAEKAATEQRRKQREQERIDKSKATEETENAEATGETEEAKETEATGEIEEAETAEETAVAGETEEAETAEETEATGEIEEAETAEETAATGEIKEAETAEETAVAGETEGAADQSARRANGEPAETIEQAATEAAGEEVAQTVPEPSRQRHAETSDDAIL